MENVNQQTPSLRVLITEDSGMYVAQGLETGIFAQANTMAKLAERFAMTYLLNKDTKMSDPAPNEVFDAWEKGKVCGVDKISFGEGIIDRPVDVRFGIA